MTLELVNSYWKETDVVSNLDLHCMLYSSSVPNRPTRMLMQNLVLNGMKGDYSATAVSDWWVTDLIPKDGLFLL